MNATQIIREIEALEPGEQAKVIQYARHLQSRQALSPDQLSVLAEELAGNPSPERARLLKEEIEQGFYGTGPGA